MSSINPTFKAAHISQQFQAACSQFDALLAQADAQELAQIRQKFYDGLKDYEQQGTLTVAFIGQYSAGKSTIISALTGRRDLHIDADIATDTTTTYGWNGIKIIDTPGLFTDRPDHDAITYGAIAKADLLVFCLTHMLFDTLTLENFKKLAYDKGYRWKIMLVVNKMSAGAGDETQKIASYRHSLTAALKPYDLDEFSISFIDARDYCEGIDNNDDFSTEISQFDTFITELNQFVERRASLTGLDTPVRILLGCLDQAQIAFARNSNEDTAFLEVLSRLSRRINQERERLRTKVKAITLEMSSAITTEGAKLASAVGDEQFESMNKQAEINVCQQYEQAEKAIESTAENAVKSIEEEVLAELNSPLAQAVVAQLSFTGAVAHNGPVNNSNTQQAQGQVEWLQKIGGQVGAGITKAATRGVASTAGSGFLRSMDVAGSSLHQGVYEVGKFIGFKFKPWQAVNVAKNIGNAAKFLGPAVAVLSIGLELHTMQQEREYEKQMAEVRRDITSQFKAITVDLDQQIKAQLQDFEAKVYGLLENNIAEARHQTETAMVTSHTEIGRIAAIRKDLDAILQDVHHAASDQEND